jgi:hypothetical protein
MSVRNVLSIDGILISAIALCSFVVIVTTGWVGDGLQGICLFNRWRACDDSTRDIMVRVGMAFVLLLLFAWYLFLLTERIWPVRVLAETRVHGRKVLIVPLSPFHKNLDGRDGKWQVVTGDKQVVNLTGDIGQDIKALNCIRAKDQTPWKWSGQQFLRVLQPHIGDGRLKHLVLIGSDTPDTGSRDTLEIAKRWVRFYSWEVEVHYELDQCLNFEEVDDLKNVLNAWIDHFKQKGIPEREIILDATLGTKTASIAVVLTTQRLKDVQFQYVTTNENPKVLAYNVVNVLTEKKALR